MFLNGIIDEVLAWINPNLSIPSLTQSRLVTRSTVMLVQLYTLVKRFYDNEAISPATRTAHTLLILLQILDSTRPVDKKWGRLACQLQLASTG